jgi:hypothetical protein
MSILFIQDSDNKFVNNVKLTEIPNHQIMLGPIDQNLYGIYYNYHFTHLILMASMLNQETLQFVSEYHTEIKCYIYGDIFITTNIVELYKNKTTFILRTKQDNITKENSIILPRLVNKELFNSLKQSPNRHNSIVCFIDNSDKIPDSLNEYLYPMTKLPIKLFNNTNIKHHQNLGTLSEIEKSNILQQVRYYLTIDEHYLSEAWASGCDVLTIEELDLIQSKKYKNKKECQTYRSFMENFLNA